jgi:hypothetical protein
VSMPHQAPDIAVRVCTTHDLVLEENAAGGLVCPGPRRHVVKRWKVVNTRTARAVYQATPEGTEGILNEKTNVKTKAQQKSKTVERAKFQDAAGQFLWLRLVEEPKRYGGDPYRIRWQLMPDAAAKKGVTAGVSKTMPDEASARSAFKAALKNAGEQGWKLAQMGMGVRKLELKPIPAPKRRAA